MRWREGGRASSESVNIKVLKKLCKSWSSQIHNLIGLAVIFRGKKTHISILQCSDAKCIKVGRSARSPSLIFSHAFSLSHPYTENSHLLTIQPDLTTPGYQGSLRTRHDPTPKFSLSDGPLLEPLANGSHTMANGKVTGDSGHLSSRLTAQSYFKTLPRDAVHTSYGTFNFLGGRLTIPNTGESHDCELTSQRSHTITFSLSLNHYITQLSFSHTLTPRVR